MVYVIALAIALPIGIALRDPFNAIVTYWGLHHLVARLATIVCAAIILASVQTLARKLGWVRERSEVSRGTPQ
jgi:hypothetical protein